MRRRKKMPSWQTAADYSACPVFPLWRVTWSRAAFTVHNLLARARFNLAVQRFLGHRRQREQQLERGRGRPAGVEATPQQGLGDVRAAAAAADAGRRRQEAAKAAGVARRQAETHSTT